MIEICPFIATIQDGSIADMYALIKNDTVVCYWLNDKRQAEAYKYKFQLHGFYSEEAKQMWKEKVMPIMNKKLDLPN